MQELFFKLLYCLLYGIVVWAVKTVVTVVVPLIKTQFESSKYNWAAEIIEYTVRAYEQTISEPGMGEEKYKLVVDQVTAELNKLGIKLTSQQITTLIEAAVQTMNAEKIPELETAEVCKVVELDTNE